MENFETWWESLTTVYKFFWTTSVLTTAVFITMVIASVVGGDSDGDSDTDGGDSPDGGGMMSYILSFKTILAFLLGASWTGLTALYQGCSIFAITLISLISGVLMMALMAFLLSLFVKLQYSSTLEMTNTIGATGVVYVTVQPNRLQGGQVEILVNNSYKTFDAVCDDGTPLPPEQPIVVTGLLDNNVLLVERLPDDQVLATSDNTVTTI